MNNYGQLSLDDHFVTWSMVDYLYQTRREGFSRLLDGLKGRTNDQGFADGSDLPGVHRELFKDELGLTYSQFDTQWQEWVEENY